MDRPPPFTISRIGKVDNIEMVDALGSYILCDIPAQSVDLFVSASSYWCTKASAEQYAERVLAQYKFAQEQFGSMAVSSNVQRDNQTPHVHFVGGSHNG
ncbi:MAG: hypothetical protein GW858_07820 [Sphingomonadales bacterium]|nr:hypothetical protein [Sphingomonadales bacterium]NCQ20414.1 hypothetical protein [Sphingomonadales bacterium]NCT03022.1 hypothetical protein [Sphingomonadales bacterium]